MEWEDLFDEYGYGNDPDGVLGEPRPLNSGGFGEDTEEDWFLTMPGEAHVPGPTLHP